MLAIRRKEARHSANFRGKNIILVNICLLLCKILKTSMTYQSPFVLVKLRRDSFSVNKKNFFTSKLDLNLRKKLVKRYIWSIALYDAETWILRELDRKYLESLERWRRREMEKIGWRDL